MKINIILLIKQFLSAILMFAAPFCVKANINYNKQLGSTDKKYKPVYFSGHFDNGVKHNDTLRVSFWTNLYSDMNAAYLSHRDLLIPIRNGNFWFKIDSVSDVSYISLSAVMGQRDMSLSLFSPSIQLCVVEPGDDVHLNVKEAKPIRRFNIPSATLDSVCVNCYSVSFTGKGAAKYNCQFKIGKALTDAERAYVSGGWKLLPKTQMPIKSIKDEVAKDREIANYFAKEPLQILSEYKAHVKNNIYQILKSNLTGYLQAQYLMTPVFYTVPRFAGDVAGFKNVLSLIDTKYDNVTDKTACRSVYYLDFLLAKTKLENLLRRYISSDTDTSPAKLIEYNELYHTIKSTYKGLLREKLIISFFINYSSFFSISPGLVDDASNILKDEENIEFLAGLTQRNQVGKQAFNFSLPDSTDTNITLHQYLGKVVFIDFWFTGCKGCTEYYTHQVSKAENDFKHNKDVIFIAISLDASKTPWIKSVHSGRYTSPDVINLYKAKSSPIMKQFLVTSCPHPLLIDRKGRIFSNSDEDLRLHDVAGLEAEINKALASK